METWINEDRMKIEDGYGSFSLERVRFINEKIGVSLPLLFIEMMKDNDGGFPEKNIFSFQDVRKNKVRLKCIGSFLSFNENQYGDILETYLDPPEFFPKGLVAFGEDGGGDFICFDYREGKDNPNPPIVYWSHEANEGEDVSFIAKDFETFIGMLKSEDELDK